MYRKNCTSLEPSCLDKKLTSVNVKCSKILIVFLKFVRLYHLYNVCVLSNIT